MSVKIYSKAKDGSKKLSKNFSVFEFDCNDKSDEILIDTELVTYLQKIRDWAKAPVIITSAYRNDTYNRLVGGVSNSYHTKGMAADIVIRGKKPIEVAKFAESLGILGIGCYNDDLFNHIDTRKSKFFWYNQSSTPTSSFYDYNYTTGDYIVRPELLNVRTGPGTHYSTKKFSQLTANAQQQIMNIAKVRANGYVCGMTCTVLEVKENWGRTPSGWICLDYCRRYT